MNQIITGEAALAFATNTKRPSVDKRTGLVVNSMLTKEEWSILDRRVIEQVRRRLQIVTAMRAAGLVQTTTYANMLSQWRVSSERPEATISMDGRTRTNLARTDKLTFGVPIPIIHDAYSIGRRELLASRTLGADLDTTEAVAAAAVVAEAAESMIFNGSTVVVSGSTIYGLTTHPARVTGTATSFGGGDFGTVSNVLPTFRGVIAGLGANRYHGPFRVDIANTQYIELLARYTDGSGQTVLDSVLALPHIESVNASDFLADGVMTVTQMSTDVIDLIQAGGVVENREWVAPDGEELFFKVMMVMAPRLKQDYNGNLGVAHVTGC